MLFLFLAALALGACGASPSYIAASGGPVPIAGDTSLAPEVEFTLVTAFEQGQLAFMGKGGAIDGQLNPTLDVEVGQVVKINLINGDAMEHDFSLPHETLKTESVLGKGAQAGLVFQADEPGEFSYLCSIQGHEQAGMKGTLQVHGEITGESPVQGQ